MICVWRRQWAAFGLRCGSQWPPRNADCRGGVFAVFAKISPPTRFTIREDFPAHLSTLRAYPIGFLPISHPLHGVWDYLQLGDAHALGLALQQHGYAVFLCAAA